VKLRVLGCFGAEIPKCKLTCFLINDDLLIDAGAVTNTLELEEQFKIKYIILSHTHLDHIRDLVFLADNRGLNSKEAESLEIWAIKETIDILKKHILNGLVWPDFTKILSISGKPILILKEMPEEEEIIIGEYKITAIRVNHPGPSVGYLIEDRGKSILFTGDTGVTNRIWEIANKKENLAAVIVEVSFPNRMQDLANASYHLTPKNLALEISKLKRDVPIFVFHIKPQFLKEIEEELKNLSNPKIQIMKQDKIYKF